MLLEDSHDRPVLVDIWRFQLQGNLSLRSSVSDCLGRGCQVFSYLVAVSALPQSFPVAAVVTVSVQAEGPVGNFVADLHHISAGAGIAQVGEHLFRVELD